MSEGISQESHLDLIPSEEWYEHLLRYGLYLGALFQLSCILAVIFLPSQSKPGEESEKDENFSEEEFESSEGRLNRSHFSTSTNNKRMDRKKKR